MAERTAPNYSGILNSIASKKDVTKQYEIFARFVNENELGNTATMIAEIGDKSIKNMAHAKVFMMLLDYNNLFRAVGKTRYDQLMFTLKNSERFKKVHALLEKTKSIKSKQVNLYKAKVGILIQILFLLAERIEEQGMPQLNLTGIEMAMKLLDSHSSEKKMVIDLNDYGKGYWNLLVNLLKEADFRSNDKIRYEQILSESLIKNYSSGAHLAGTSKGGEGQSALSDAMLTRLGRNIVKRIGLLLRTVQMYQSTEHPSVSVSLDALSATITDALEQRPSLTFTRIGSDLLIDDVKNRKKEKFVDDFVSQLDARNINSITITKGVSLEEIRVLVSLVSMTENQVKKAGGAKQILNRGGVSNILVDQFKYGIISADQIEATETVSQDEKMIENIIFTELVGRLKSGKGIGDLKTEEVGAAFKQLITGAFRKDKQAKQTLAQMLLAVDPSLAERALFSKEGIRDDIQWSSAQGMIDELIRELPKGPPADRQLALTNLLKMTELAIAKNKDTTLTLIIEKVIERMRLRERDLEVAAKVVEVLANITKHLIVNHKYNQALEILRNMYQVHNRCEHLPTEKKDELYIAMPSIINRGFKLVSDPEIAEVMVRDLDSDSLESVDRIAKIMEILDTEEVVNALLGGFQNESRSVRNRCFQALLSIGDKTLAVCNWKLKSLEDTGLFRRQTNGSMDDSDYYTARNAIELVSKLGGLEEINLLKDLADDQDPRIRREIMLSLSRLDPQEGAFLARLRLTDVDPEMVKSAISTLGNLRVEGSENDLIDLFFAQPELRTSILTALASIGGLESEKIMVAAAKLRFGGNLGRIYRMDPELRLIAIKSLGQCGGKIGGIALRRFIRILKNPFFRLFLWPLRSMGKRKDLLKIAQDALARVDFRLKMKI